MLLTMIQEATARNDRKQETEAQDAAGDPGPERSRWDGPHAEIVSDDAEEFEEQQTGVQLSYTLKEQEVYNFLNSAEARERSKKKYFLDILCIVFLFALYSFNCVYSKRFDVPMFCLIVAVSVILSYYLRKLRPRMKSRADAGVLAGETVRMTVYPDYILLGEQEIPMDGTWERVVTESMIALFPLKKDEYSECPIFLPLRCMEPAILPEVQAMLFAGTRRVAADKGPAFYTE